MRYFLWDDSCSHGVFLALRNWMESSRHGPAVVGRNSISSHRSTQNAFNCSVMAFHFFLRPLFANTYRCSNAVRLFLTRPCPHPHAGNEGYEERRKPGGLLKKKTSGIYLKLSWACHSLHCQMIGRLLCFYKHGRWGHGAKRHICQLDNVRSMYQWNEWDLEPCARA